MTHFKLVFIFIFVILSQVSNYVAGLNILCIVSLPHKSHYMAFQTLFRELAIRGHSVTVINNYPEANLSYDLKFINLNWGTAPVSSISDFENRHPTFMHWYNLIDHFITLGPAGVRRDCEILFNNKDVMALRERRDEFDVIFVEQFVSDCGLVFAALSFDAPIIGITSHTLLPWAYPRLGIPFNFGSNAFYFSPFGTKPSIYQKVESYLMNLYVGTIGRWQIQRGIYDTFNKYLPDVKFDVENLAGNGIKMMFAYQHHSITGARLLPPQLLEIAGIHIEKPKPVSESIEQFMSTAKHGVIYVSFGSFLKANTMSKNKMEQFIQAFKKIPQKILWKVDNDTFTTRDDKLLTSNWFPQLDILCHPKVIAFVSHGGMLSTSEAAHCGKPLLTIPFFGDQFSNAAAVAESGLGTTMYLDHITADNLAHAIKHLTSSEMQQNSQRVSKLWHDRPINVMDSAIYWTEYVARHKTAPPQFTSGHRTWLQNSLIDVYSVLISIIMGIILSIYLLGKIIISVLKLLTRLFKSGNKQQIKKKRS